MTDAATYETDGPIGLLTLNRPEARNVLGEPGDGELFRSLCARINADRGVKCVILTGAGKVFSAGGNLKAMKDKSGPFAGTGAEIREGYRRDVHPIVTSLWKQEVPLIAAVNGPAIGLGNDVACLADMRIAADTAVMGSTFLKVGLVPGDGGSWLLPRIIGLARASEMLFAAKAIDAKTALDWGLVSQVVPADELMPTARALAEDIVKQPTDVLRLTKRIVRKGMETDFETIMDLSAASQALAHQTEDHMEAVNAFLEKRDPDFKGR